MYCIVCRLTSQKVSILGAQPTKLCVAMAFKGCNLVFGNQKFKIKDATAAIKNDWHMIQVGDFYTSLLAIKHKYADKNFLPINNFTSIKPLILS